MPSVIKSRRVEQIDGVVVIPDNTPAPAGAPEEETAAKEETVDLSEQIEALLGQAREQAQREASEILAKAQAEREALLGQARQEAERLRDEAVENGYGAAKAELRGEIERCLQTVDEVLDELGRRQTDYLQRYCRELGSLAADVASKVLAKRIAADDTELVELVRRAVSSVKNAEWISVEVSDKLTGLVERLQEEFSSPSYGGRVEVAPRPMPPDGCVLRTPEGTVDASVPTQMGNLRAAFEQLLGG